MTIFIGQRALFQPNLVVDANARRSFGLPANVDAGVRRLLEACDQTRLEKGTQRLTGAKDDMMWKALDRSEAEREAAIREYLRWEVDLVDATYDDPDFGFRRFA